MKYLIKMNAVKGDANLASKVLNEVLGSGSPRLIAELISKGGNVYENLNLSAAEYWAKELIKKGIPVEIIAMEKQDMETYQINLIDAGESKLALVKSIREILGVSLKEAKNIVDTLGEIGVYDDYKEAVQIQNQLEKAGAEIKITVFGEKKQEPQPEPKPQPKPSEQFLVRLLDAGGSLSLPIDVIMDITGFEFEEAREIVDSLGVVAENLDINEAVHIKGRMEEVGAKVRIEEMSSFEPEPDGPIDPDPPMDYVVSGRVFNSNGMKLPFVSIVLVDKKGSNEIILAEGHTDEDGFYKIHYKPSLKTHPEDYSNIQVQVIGDGEKQASAKSDVRYNAKSIEENLDIVIPVEGPENPDLPKDYVVSGKVFNSNGMQLSYASILLVDKNVGGESLLAEGHTDEDGFYKIIYSPTAKCPPGNPDIQVHFNGEQTREKQASIKSEIRYNAQRVEENLNILVPVEILPKPEAEYNRLLSVLKDQLCAKTEDELAEILAGLREDEDQQDITYLTNKAGWDARLIAMMALSHEESNKTKLPAPLYYAFYRAGISMSETSLLNIDAHTAKEIWIKAIEQNIIDTSLEGHLDKYLELFKQNNTKSHLEDDNPIGVSSLNTMLSLSLKNDKQKEEFTELYFNQNPEDGNFWEGIEERFGSELKNNLQLDGKLGVLTLNNAPLIKILRDQKSITEDPIELVRNGFYKANAWEKIIRDSKIPLPPDLPGENKADKQKVYAVSMAQQLKASYPTAVLSAQVKGQELTLTNANSRTKVTNFLDKYQSTFIIGRQPITQFIAEERISLEEPILHELKRLERINRISPSDEAMFVLSSAGIDSAHAAVQLGEEVMVNKLVAGGLDKVQAQIAYAKSNQVQSAVLSFVTTLITNRNTPQIAALTSSQMETKNPDRVVNPTIEGLFGEMDFCDCNHCRSVLSPAAYLVELLQFIDKQSTKENPGKNPLDALLERRPDIEHIQLTCENTNTVLPYIDLVNEILEHYSVNESITDFKGYNNTGDPSTEELLSNPQFVEKEAYNILKEQVYPFQLPFNQPLVNLRRLFEHLGVPLYQAMQLLRPNDEIETWRNIDMEYLDISPEEYAIFTQSEKSIDEYYGEKELPEGLDFFFKINNTYAKDFSRKVGVSYKELTRLVMTRFINPASSLIPKLEKLEVNIQEILAFLNNKISDSDFDALLPKELNNEFYDGDVKAWLREHSETIKSLILLEDRSGAEDECSFVQLELRRVNNTSITDLDYFKFMRFIRFWKKLGWTIEQTDKVISALWPTANDANTIELLNEGFIMLINRTAHLKRVMELLNTNPKRDLLKVLGLFGTIDTQGSDSLYKELFLDTSIMNTDKIFFANSSENYLTDTDAKMIDHELAILAAFNLTSDMLHLIVHRIMVMEDLGHIKEVQLSLKNVTIIHRYAYLSRQLKLSIEELFILKDLTQINPFGVLEEVNPSIIKFIELVQQLKQSPFKIPQLTYYLRHQDLSDGASPSDNDILAMAKQVNDALSQVENEYKSMEDVTGETVRNKMTLVYPQEAVDQFFSIINNDLSFTVNYIHQESILEPELQEVTDKLLYNSFKKSLVYNGVMSSKTLQDLKVTIGNNQTELLAAVQSIFDRGQTELKKFFATYPELESPYDHFIGSMDFEQLLDQILTDFKKRLKKLAITETFANTLGMEHNIVTALLEDNNILHAHSESNFDNPKNELAIEDYLAIETNGVYAQFVLGDDSSITKVIENINSFPEDLSFFETQSIKKVSYSFYVEVTDKSFYNFHLKTNNDAIVSLSVNKIEKTGSHNNGIWENRDPIEFGSNRYHHIEIQITNLTETPILKWASEYKTAYQLIPNNRLFPGQLIQIFKQSYLRFLKVSAIVENLKMSKEEIRYFSNVFKIEGMGFLNAVPVRFDSLKTDIHQKLWGVIINYLYYQQLKIDLDVRNDDLVKVFENPNATYQNSQQEERSLLLKLTNWSETNLDELLSSFNLERLDLQNIESFKRILEAYLLVANSGLQAKTLMKATTNNPEIDDPITMQQAIRLKYDKKAWNEVIQPINDALRNEQRDALVAYVLQIMQKHNIKNIDTADKLFEYFLIDVQMDACMKTSRIKQAISTVQLFVQRVLLNLEQKDDENLRVNPASIDSKQWEWMKRYRVWEANRKVFIMPENWLEPELRDNKSPIFKELESELLQSDITDEQARNVMINYLEKLDNIAKLDIAGMCLQENKSKKEDKLCNAGDVLHIIGKTQGTGAKYYYRRYEGGYFTPWEKVDLDIEGAPVLPVIWNDRLFLFWLNIIQKGVSNNDSPLKNGTSSDARSHEGHQTYEGEYVKRTAPLTQASESNKLIDATFDSSALQGNDKVDVEISLSWSEYFNGKWQPRRMSDIDSPAILKNLDARRFQRNRIEIYKFENTPNELIIQFHYKHNESDIYLRKFMLKNKYNAKIGLLDNTIEISAGDFETLDEFRWLNVPRRMLTDGSGVRANFFDQKNLNRLLYFHKILDKTNGLKDVTKYLSSSPYHTTFFLQNDDHIFFVQLEKEIVSPLGDEFEILVPFYPVYAGPFYLPPIAEIPDIRLPGGPLFDINPGYVDPIQLGLNFQNSGIKHGLPGSNTIDFKGIAIAASGIQSKDITSNTINVKKI